MIELLKTNNMVALNYVEVLFKDAEINYQIIHPHMSSLYGYNGPFIQRVLVDEDHFDRAERLLIDAGLAEELPQKKS